MAKVISKNKTIEKKDMVLSYVIEGMNNGSWISNLVSTLEESGVEIKGIFVHYITDEYEGPSVFKNNNLEEYLKRYKGQISDNVTDWINIDCLFKEIRFIISMDSRLNRLDVDFVDYKENVNFDDVVSRAVGKQK